MAADAFVSELETESENSHKISSLHSCGFGRPSHRVGSLRNIKAAQLVPLGASFALKFPPSAHMRSAMLRSRGRAARCSVTPRAVLICFLTMWLIVSWGF